MFLQIQTIFTQFNNTIKYTNITKYTTIQTLQLCNHPKYQIEYSQPQI